MENFHFKKQYGQNFLQDKFVLQQISDSVTVTEKDLIIEIGPGHGALTKYLVEKGCDVLAFEIDVDVKPVLDQIKSPNLQVVYEDFMQVDFSTYDLSKYEYIYVMANIPYYITTPILEKIVFSNLGESKLVLMVQKEVAERFSAIPGSSDYGSVTVFLNYYYKIHKLCDVSRNSFYPVPKVDSAVIVLDKVSRDKVDIKFFGFVKQCFQFKRKNIKNNLSHYDTSKIEGVLHSYGHSLQSRAEEFSLQEFIDLYEAIQ